MSSPMLGLLALIPAMLGPLPSAERTITALLCSGGKTIEVKISTSGDVPPMDGAPCHRDGCHGASCRKKGGAAA